MSRGLKEAESMNIKVNIDREKNRESEQDLRERIGDQAYEVTQNEGTEPPFSGKYDNFFEKGIYVDIVSGEPLFTSLDKFDSGCGWPAFSKGIGTNAMRYDRDFSFGMERVKVNSAGAGSHLGHVFEDGPKDRGGLRYCINSAALRFIPYDEMASEGFGKLQREAWPREEDVSPNRVIYLAGGCFWGTEKYLQQFHGVVSTEVGYANGKFLEPTYEEVCRDNTGHAETVRVVYDPQKISLGELVSRYFDVIDPLSVNHQGGDFGSQYRTGIYFVDDAQLAEIRPVYDALAEKLGEPLAVELIPIDNYSVAEEYHQKYLDKNPGGYCHIPGRMMHIEEHEE